MSWPIKPQKLDVDLVGSWLRTGVEKLKEALQTIESIHDYNDPVVVEKIKSAEMDLRQLRKFISEK